MEDLILKKAYSLQGVYEGSRNYTRTIYECINDGNDEDCRDYYCILDKAPCYVSHIAENVWEIQEHYYGATWKVVRND